MRNLHLFDDRRDLSPDASAFFAGIDQGLGGRFFFVSPYDPQVRLVVIATVEAGWDHVSCSTRRRCPTWNEMEWIKRQFFAPEETAMQLHVPSADHVNVHRYCLHLWRPLWQEIPRPPAVMV